MEAPKRNSVMHLCQLITGDRFYFKSDKKKQVYELRFHTMVNVYGQMKKMSVCKKDKSETERFDANRIVIFLRRTKQLIRRARIFSIENYFIH